ncbi:MAG TPA: glycosyltransferase family 39 protein, partial [Ktedonobacterales bacterium]|nr:glycosyltransferase family 39 protein [Ktedonobacterales bacterium]
EARTGMTASEQRQAVGGAEKAAPGDEAATRWTWLRYPDFWIAVALGAVLRLWALGSSNFLFDQASLMTLARQAVRLHLLPVTSMNYSVGILQPPLSIYLLIPFTLFGTNPLPAVVAVALWNVFGVALCYIFTLRYFGRRVAAVASLLFAAGPTAVLYSRFLWQSNTLPPLYTLYAVALFALGIRGKRGVFPIAVLLLMLGVLVHPTALLLAPALIAAVLLAPRRPRWREYALSAALIAVLLLPTLVWEGVSNWSDLHQLVAYSSGHAKVDPEVFFRLYQALGAPFLPQGGSVPHAAPRSLAGAVRLLMAPITDPILGAASPFAALSHLYVALALAMVLLFAVGWLTLTARILAPARTHWQQRRGRPAERMGAALRALSADATWRAYVLLWLLVTVPLAVLLRHSSPILPHYLLVLYPNAFLTCALGILSLAEAAGRLAQRIRLRAPSAPALALALVGALTLGQAAQSLLYTLSIATGQFDAQAADYGYPLGALQQADARLSQLQRQSRARVIYIAESLPESASMDYILVREHPDRVGFEDTCLVLPPQNAGLALIVAADGSQDARTLAGLPNAALLAQIAMAGNAPLTVYRVADPPSRSEEGRVAGAPPAPLPGEAALGPIPLQDASGQGVELEAAQTDGKQVRLRWTALASTPAGSVAPNLRVLARGVTSSGQPGAVRGFQDCAPTRWQAGAMLFTWLPAPAAVGGTLAPLLIQAQERVTNFAMPAFGPIRLLSFRLVSTPWNPIAPHLSAGQSPTGVRVVDGGVLLGASSIGNPSASASGAAGS